MPVIGEVRMFSFADPVRLQKVGWLPCNGERFDKHDYPRLHRVLQERWGSPATGQVFQVPDLRGFFVRGWAPPPTNASAPGDYISIGDPSAADRKPLYPNGATGDTVGSYQPDEVGPHRHLVLYGNPYPGGDHGGGWHYGGDTPGKNTEPSTGSESRPKNATLLFAIYAGARGVASDQLIDPEKAE